MKQERVDILITRQGLFASREQAKRAIMAGQVVDDHDERLDKPGEKRPLATQFRIKGTPNPYVSRGGFKLAKAQQVFQLNFEQKIVLDIGSSTGGFTDVALQNGAKLVYALDVGYNQLAWKLREDPRVKVMEKVNFRYSQRDDFTEGQPEVAVSDVSFISLKLILPPLTKILVTGGHAIVLIKPQFEAGPEQVGKHGIVRQPKVHQQVLMDILTFMPTIGFEVKQLDYSPITGGSGNIEFLADLVLGGDEGLTGTALQQTIETVVKEAWAQLK